MAIRLTRSLPAMVAAVALLSAACSSSKSPGGGDSTPPATGSSATAAKSTLTLADLEKKVDLTQCGKATRTIKHDLGTTTIKGDPTRIVVLEFSFASAVADLGIKPVGVADDNKPARVKALGVDLGNYTSVGLRQSPNLEVISSLKPDLIIADTNRDKKIYPQLSAIAPTVSYNSRAGSYEGILASDLAIAVVANKCQVMQDVLTKHFQTMDGLAARVPAGQHPTFLFAPVDETTFYGHPADQWETSILQTLGLQPVLPPKPGSSYEELTLEQLFAHNPDVLFLGKTSDKTIIDQWQSSPVWKQITAVKNNKVFDVDEALWSVDRSIEDSEVVARQAITDIYGGS